MYIYIYRAQCIYSFYSDRFRKAMSCCPACNPVVYTGILFGGGRGAQQIPLRTEDRENGDLGALFP